MLEALKTKKKSTALRLASRPIFISDAVVPLR
jgi:hypothetical protein